MKKAKMMMGTLLLMMVFTVTALAAQESRVQLSSSDGKTVGTGTLSVIWSWLEKDAGAATTMVDADSQNTARGVMVSVFGYQNGDVVCHEYGLKEVSVAVVARGNCDRFHSFHALTVSGSSTTPLGSGSNGENDIEY